MDRLKIKSWLINMLVRDVEELCWRNDVKWSSPIAHTLRDLRDVHAPAVFFGGVLRSLLLSRVQSGKLGRPRDVDIVVAGASLTSLRDRFSKDIIRETRFGGLKMEREECEFDLWPLEKTWAFQQNKAYFPGFHELPMTTFFNLEAIAIDVWPHSGRKRNVYYGNGQFFDGIIDRVLELNSEENPFPALCITRAIVFAATTKFAIGPRLARYLANIGPGISDEDLLIAQRKHYGHVRFDTDLIRRCIESAAYHVRREPSKPSKLPIPRQLRLWSEEELFIQ